MVLRIPAAAAAALTVLFVSLTARDGSSRAPSSSPHPAAALSGLVLMPGHLLHTTTIDPAVRRAGMAGGPGAASGNQRLLLAAGAVLGLGLLNKYQIGALAPTLVVGVAIAGPRALLRSPWFLGGALLALVMWLTNLWWQAQHGWPQIEMAHLLSKLSSRCTNIFRTNAVCVGHLPRTAVDHGAGPAAAHASVRFLGGSRRPSCWQACTLRRAGPRCTSSAPTRRYFTAGGLAINGWLHERQPLRHVTIGGRCWQPQLSCVRRAAGAAGAAGGQSVRHSGTRQRSHGRAVGWPELAATVKEVPKLPAGQREHAVILTDDFGEAAAVERFAVDRSRIPVYSGQRGYADWGPPPELADTMVIVARAARPEPPAWAVRACRAGLRLVARTGNVHGITATEENPRACLAVHRGGRAMGDLCGRMSATSTGWRSWRRDPSGTCCPHSLPLPRGSVRSIFRPVSSRSPGRANTLTGPGMPVNRVEDRSTASRSGG